MSIYSTQQLMGKRVISSDGKEVGEIISIDIDVTSWSVRTLDVKLDREVLEPLSLKKPVFGSQSIKIGIDKIAAISDTVVLQVQLLDLAPADVPKPDAPEA